MIGNCLLIEPKYTGRAKSNGASSDVFPMDTVNLQCGSSSRDQADAVMPTKTCFDNLRIRWRLHQAADRSRTNGLGPSNEARIADEAPVPVRRMFRDVGVDGV